MAGKVPKLKRPVFVALDIDDPKKAFSFAKKLKNDVGGFKIGPRLAYQLGGGGIKKFAKLGPVFIDNKYFDIPSTMAAAVEASFNAGASFVTVHALAGKEALVAIANLEAQLQKKRPFRVLAVTILTSWNENSYPPSIVPSRVQDHVHSLAKFAIDCGISGIVCSPHEVASLKADFPGVYFVTPGIRLEGDSKNDQSRTMTPSEALNAGASALVVGRSILQAKDPVKVAKQLVKR